MFIGFGLRFVARRHSETVALIISRKSQMAHLQLANYSQLLEQCSWVPRDRNALLKWNTTSFFFSPPIAFVSGEWNKFRFIHHSRILKSKWNRCWPLNSLFMAHSPRSLKYATLIIVYYHLWRFFSFFFVFRTDCIRLNLYVATGPMRRWGKQKSHKSGRSYSCW